MCEQGTTEIIRLHHPTPRGFTTAGVDACIAPLIQALNDGGFQTIASCCGHGIRPGSIILEDGRELLILPDYESARKLDNLWPPINTPPSSKELH